MTSDGRSRATYFLQMLEEGKRFTEELLKENESLRAVNLALRTKLKDHEDHAASFDWKTLKDHLSRAESERASALYELTQLRRQLSSVEEENREFAERYVRIERQNGHLASLYVASHNLHATLDFQQILAYVKEIVINLIGSEEFGVYLADDQGTDFLLCAHEGLDEVSGRVLVRTGIVRTAFETQRSAFASEQEHAQGSPLVAVPLSVDETLLGAVVIYRLLPHKHGLGQLDRELIDLLAGQAATALYASRLYAQSERKRATLQGFVDLLKERA